MRADQPVRAAAWPTWSASICANPNRDVSRLAGPYPRGRARDAEEALLGDVLPGRFAQRPEVVLAHVAARADEVEQILELRHLEILRPGDELDLDVGEERRELPDFAEVVQADRRRAEPAARPQDARDLGERPRAVLDVEEHVVRDHRVEGLVGERELQHVGDGVLRPVAEHAARRVDHARREVGQREAPAGRDAVEVLAPDVPVAAADLEDVRLVAERVAVEDPVRVVDWSARVLVVERDPRAEVGVRRVLLTKPLALAHASPRSRATSRSSAASSAPAPRRRFRIPSRSSISSSTSRSVRPAGVVILRRRSRSSSSGASSSHSPWNGAQLSSLRAWSAAIASGSTSASQSAMPHAMPVRSRPPAQWMAAGGSAFPSSVSACASSWRYVSASAWYASRIEGQSHAAGTGRGSIPWRSTGTGSGSYSSPLSSRSGRRSTTSETP